MKDFIEELHRNGQHYGKLLDFDFVRIFMMIRNAVVIVNPAISNTPGYKPYDDGLEMDIFVKVIRDGKDF